MWCAMKMESIASERESSNTSPPLLLIWVSLIPIVADSTARCAFQTAIMVEPPNKKDDIVIKEFISRILLSQSNFS